jgi:hypothetical protein
MAAEAEEMMTLELLELVDLAEVVLVEIMQEQLILVVEAVVTSQEMQVRAVRVL